MNPLSTIRPITLRKQIVEQVRQAIIEGFLKPNDHITEAELTRKLGVSRTPVREALILLESEGLVDFVPNRGSFVRAFVPEEVDEIFSMRTALENFAAELLVDKLTDDDFKHMRQIIDEISDAIDQQNFGAARRNDMAFHQYLIERTGHSLLIKNWRQIVAQIAALLHIRNKALPDYPELKATQEDHEAFFQAYQERDLKIIQNLHRTINRRVAQECQEALAIYNAE